MSGNIPIVLCLVLINIWIIGNDRDNGNTDIKSN